MRTIFFLLAIWLGFANAVCANTDNYLWKTTIDPNDVTIVRDKWGVPHVFGKTNADVAYGLAWANAEDDFFTMQELLVASKGLSGKMMGKEGAERDFFAHSIGFRQRVNQDFHLLSDEYVRYLEGYCQGINAFAESHKKEIRVRGSFPINPKDVIGGSMFALSALIGVPDAVGNIVNGTFDKDEKSKLPYGSNAFAFNSNATNDGSTMLCINPHQPVTGAFSWYEAHLCSEEGMNIHGAMFPGGGTIFLGSNENLGWSHTFNHLDLVDVFQLEMHPKKKHTYKFNGKWRKLEKRPVWLKVKLGKIVIPVKKMTYWSVFGATLKSPEKEYFAVKFGANEKVKIGEQWYKMNLASSYSEFYQALKMGSITMFNIIYADKNDTVFYINNSLIPKRNAEVDYSGVVRSNSNKTLWTEYHATEDLVQTLNPDCGWVFNTNNNPAHATVKEEWQDLNDWPLYYGFEDDAGENNRAERFLELMREPASKTVSYDRMKAMKFDCQFPKYSAFQESMKNLLEVTPTDHPELAALITAIQNWDKKAHKNSRGAAAWLITFQKVFNTLGFADGEFKKAVSISDTTYLTALAWAKQQIDTHYDGKIPTLGDVQRHVRADINLPLSGFPDVLAANYNQPWKNGRYKPWVADSYVHFVQWKKNGEIRIETLHPFGASGRKDSPHYTDQMQLYANQKTKIMTLDKAKIIAEAVATYHPGEAVSISPRGQ